jgi:hypothetical protein
MEKWLWNETRGKNNHKRILNFNNEYENSIAIWKILVTFFIGFSLQYLYFYGQSDSLLLIAATTLATNFYLLPLASVDDGVGSVRVEPLKRKTLIIS